MRHADTITVTVEDMVAAGFSPTAIADGADVITINGKRHVGYRIGSPAHEAYSAAHRRKRAAKRPARRPASTSTAAPRAGKADRAAKAAFACHLVSAGLTVLLRHIGER